MGVDYVLFERLVELSTRFSPSGRTLMLGRQSFVIQNRLRKRYETVLTKHKIDGGRAQFLQDDGYSETLMRRLGFGEMESMDFSDFEGATIIHDLNKPVPETLEGQFDLIFDGGTVEHIFNIPVVLENVFRMLKPGGRFVSANGMNGWPGHGLYQFNPELVWTFWSRGCGCNVVDCRGITQMPLAGEFHLPFPDPAIKGKRLRLRGRVPDTRFYLFYEVERLPESQLNGSVLQSDYEIRWAGHGNAAKTRVDALEGAI